MRQDDVADWLERGGDHRLVPGTNGLSPYRVALAGRDTVAFGSCTASNPGPRALAAAEHALQTWQGAGSSADAVYALQQENRDALRQTFSLPESVAIALTPSGTDALYLVNAMVHHRGLRAHHVVVGASELGGGTVRACRGQTFSERTPLGGTVQQGTSLTGVAERSSAEAVYLREGQGQRVDDASIDTLVAARVAAAMGPETQVVVHLVAHSKTGLRAPSFDLGKRLMAEYGDAVMVFVDAAQGRMSPADMRTALESGFVVLFTGSKFYSGPPFSGALFLPGDWAADPGPLAESLNPWFDQASMPPHWIGTRASLTHASNPGLMLRWCAAVAEIKAYHAILPRQRAAVYATFAGAVHEVLGPCAPIDLEFPLPPTHALVTGLGAFPTVFGFRVRDDQGWLGAPAMKRLHALLDDDDQVHAHHLGQPVSLGPPGDDRRVLLRIALGARMITDLAGEPDAGGAWMRQQVGALRDNIEAIVQRNVLGSCDGA